MTKLAIVCHPSVPVPPDELEQWLEHQVIDLREAAPGGTVRMSRLTQALPSRDVDGGWLLQLELSGRQRLLVNDRLVEALRDMRLLGFQPTVLMPMEELEWTAAASQGSDASSGWW
jgi:hypothetical protein